MPGRLMHLMLVPAKKRGEPSVMLFESGVMWSIKVVATRGGGASSTGGISGSAHGLRGDFGHARGIARPHVLTVCKRLASRSPQASA